MTPIQQAFRDAKYITPLNFPAGCLLFGTLVILLVLYSLTENNDPHPHR